MQYAIAIVGASSNAGGQTEPATAVSNATVHARWRRLRFGAP